MLGIRFPISHHQTLEVGSRKTESEFQKIGRWKLDLQFSPSNFQLPDAGCWKSQAFFRTLEVEIQAPEVERRKLDSNFWKFEVGLEEASLDQPSQYFFRAKTCRKTRKNGGFQGGKPPGRNARGNPWGPVRTRGGPRPLLGLFSHLQDVLFSPN